VLLGARLRFRKITSAVADLKTLFKEIDDNQKAIDKIKENYAAPAWKRKPSTKERPTSKKELKEFTFFYLKRRGISTLVKKDRQASFGFRTEEGRRENHKRIEIAEEAS